jgi:hypothetical protein
VIVSRVPWLVADYLPGAVAREQRAELADLARQRDPGEGVG